MTSLLAKQEFAVPRVVARVNHPRNEWMFTEQWGVDAAVSPPHLLTALVEEAVTVGDVVRLLKLERGRSSLVELTLRGDVDGRGPARVRAAPAVDSSLVAIVRDGHVVIPQPETVLAPRASRRLDRRGIGAPPQRRRGCTASPQGGLSSSSETFHPSGFPLHNAPRWRPLAPDALAERPSTESVEALTGTLRWLQPTSWRPYWTPQAGWSTEVKRAPLRVYLGAAPAWGRPRDAVGGAAPAGAGTEVVVGIVETYGRPKTRALLEGMEIVPPQRLEYRGTTFEEMDTHAIIARAPEVALVDELAHTNIPGSGRAKRWEDVVDLLAQGISVITTVNVQHLASLNDVVAAITGIRQQETVPDWVLDLADQVELVDMSPHALQRRMMHGNVYPDSRKAELALRRFFTSENLTALRELALMRVANLVDDELLNRWSKGHVPETRERVLVCVSYPGFSEDLVRRGARIVQRAGGDLLVLHVRTEDEPGNPEWLREVEQLTHDLGGEFAVVDADTAVDGVLSFAYEQHITQIVAGEPMRTRWQELVRGSFVHKLIRRASAIDIHVIARR